MNSTYSPPPWNNAPEDLLREFESAIDSGLTDEEAATRLNTYGPNQLHGHTTRKWPGILIAQLRSPLVLLLVVAAALGFFFQNWIEGIAICIVILLNAAIGFFTELGAIRSMESLRQFNAVHVTARRGGRSKRIPAKELVLGDIVIVDAGDVIAADMRLLTASRLQANESLLTGESFPVSKSLPLLPDDTILAERANMLYKGTSITRGTALAIVASTGLQTELGQISSLVLETEDESTPLEKRLNLLGRKLIVVTLLITAFTLLMGLRSGKDLYLMIETSIALAVAAIPEGLPIIATLALARGMWRMARSNALINQLSAVETLGATNVICTDKTGTLTENKMTLAQIVPAAQGGERALLETGALCNKATLDGIGDPLEVALLIEAQKHDLSPEELHQKHPLLTEEAFDSESKRMGTSHQCGQDTLVAIKGAAEAVLPICTKLQTPEGPIPLTTAERDLWLAKNHTLASEGFRVLSFATKTTSDPTSPLYSDLTFLGHGCFIDPPRHDIQATLDECHAAGIRVVMITGDQVGTATHVAKSVHIIPPDAPQHATLGQDIPTLSQQELLETDIFARVTPKDKLDIIACHQKNGSVVAMTGDGVNDAPALKKADIGIAMGQRGTEVAREASDMVLRDDSFPTIVTAIRQGRVIFNNIRKFVVYLLSCNLSEIFVVGLAAGVNSPLPLLPLQILFLNMVTDVFPALALGAGGGNSEVMSKPPRKMSEPLIGRREWTRITLFSLLISASVLAPFAFALLKLHLPVQEAVTIAFLILASAQIFHVFNMTEPQSPLFRNEITRNPYVWVAVIVCLLLLALALFIPLFAETLKLTNPSSQGWLLVLIGSLIPPIIGRIAAGISGILALKRVPLLP